MRGSRWLVFLAGVFAGALVLAGAAGLSSRGEAAQADQDAPEWQAVIFRDFSEGGAIVQAEDDLAAFMGMLPASCALDAEPLEDGALLLLYACP